MFKNEQGRTVFKVPYSVQNRFGTIFKDIDSNLSTYGIENYSIRCSTLEEVFIKIGKEEDKIEDEE